jgi:CheY-like chemotaxis protein
MPRIRLLHWKATEAAPLIDHLRAARYQVDYDEQFCPALMRSWREDPPDAFVIDLSRLPSHGREIAIALRQSPATRRIPLVFCGGAEEKVERIRKEIPDAAYCAFSQLLSTLKRALKNPPAEPVVPTAMMYRYASRTAAQKLGIKESSRVALLDPPRDYLKVLGILPPRVQISDDSSAGASVTLCFVHQQESLPARISSVRGLAGSSKLWILWRKGGSAARGDITERAVRDCALDLGLVDYKICSVNAVWTAMAFARRSLP